MRPASLTLGPTTYTLRSAEESDVPAVAALLDPGDEPVDLAPYLRAFRSVDADPAHLLLVAEDLGGRIAATLHLVVVPGLARRGAVRGLLDDVRVGDAAHRDVLEETLLRWAADEACARGAADVVAA